MQREANQDYWSRRAFCLQLAEKDIWDSGVLSLYDGLAFDLMAVDEVDLKHIRKIRFISPDTDLVWYFDNGVWCVRQLVESNGQIREGEDLEKNIIFRTQRTALRLRRERFDVNHATQVGWYHVSLKPESAERVARAKTLVGAKASALTRSQVMGSIVGQAWEI